MYVERYTAQSKNEWDAFVRSSKNGTFLFFRDYMEYHQHRFCDHSLLIRDDGGELRALLPANLEGDVLYSHGGLTYGGFITDKSLKLPVLLRIVDEVFTGLKQSGITRCIYKTIPHIYHQHPAEEDRYALFLAGASWVRSSALAVVRSCDRIGYQERRVRGLKKALKHGLTAAHSDDIPAFWQILSALLSEVYRTQPVHSLEEIQSLKSRFPDHIKLFGCFEDGELLAGTLIFETPLVARAQYIASSPRGRELAALDLVFDHLLNDVYHTKRYFEFGTSDEKNGRHLNQGLIEQKEGFGARCVALDQYSIDVAAWAPGNLVKALI